MPVKHVAETEKQAPYTMPTDNDIDISRRKLAPRRASHRRASIKTKAVSTSVGVKVMVTAQVEVVVSVPPQVLEVIAKSDGFVPVRVNDVRVSVGLPVFVNVTVKPDAVALRDRIWETQNGRTE